MDCAVYTKGVLWQHDGLRFRARAVMYSPTEPDLLVSPVSCPLEPVSVNKSRRGEGAYEAPGFGGWRLFVGRQACVGLCMRVVPDGNQRQIRQLFNPHVGKDELGRECVQLCVDEQGKPCLSKPRFLPEGWRGTHFKET